MGSFGFDHRLTSPRRRSALSASPSRALSRRRSDLLALVSIFTPSSRYRDSTGLLPFAVAYVAMNKRDKKGQIARAGGVVKNADWKINSTYLSGSRANPEQRQTRGEAADYVRDESETYYWLLKHGNGRSTDRIRWREREGGTGRRRRRERL